MSQQANTTYNESPKALGELVLGVRVDAVPQVEADRLAAAGNFYPLTVDKDGFLRVTLPEGTKVETTSDQDVLQQIRQLLQEIRDLLLNVA